MKASADLYDQYIETYLHTEVPLDTAIDEKLLGLQGIFWCV